MARQLFVSNKDESPRMFKSDFLDFFSRVHWSTPLIVWVPVVLYCIYRSYFIMNLPIEMLIPVYFSAIFLWTFSEYILHRFIFHFHPTSEIGKRIHFMAHGVHHDYPNDSKRLVMPPAFSIILAVFFMTIFYFTLAPYHFIFFAGFATGYLMYDMLHYATHHLKTENKLFMRLKEYHMLHHYYDDENAFGVSSPFWDYVFRTELKKKTQNPD